MTARILRRALVLLLVAGGVVGAVALLLRVTNQPPEGPVTPAWDEDTCAHCRMHLGEPGFAAQLQTKDGDVLFFDDPGCLFEWVDENAPRVHAVYFHHLTEDRWIPDDRVAFVSVPRSPMGYGLGAVEEGERGAISLAEAREQVLSEPGARGKP